MSNLATRVNYINPTREEIGDIDAILAKAAAADARRKALLSKFWLKGKPVEKPVDKLPEPAPVIVPPEVAPPPEPKLIAYYNGEPITRDYIFVSTNPLAVTTADCIKYICLTEGFTKADMLGHSRISKLAYARQKITYLIRTYTALSYPEIGRRLGGRDHSTAIHSVHKISEHIRQGKYAPPTPEQIVRLVRPAAFQQEAGE
jgi:hypothetical protein